MSKITPTGLSTVVGYTGTNPLGIALDSAGDIYVANYGSNDVSKITQAPSRPLVAWSKKAKVVSASIKPVSGVTYRMTATKGSRTKSGACRNVTLGRKKIKRNSCKIKLTKGKWRVAITPRKGALVGIANRRAFTIR